MSGAKPKTIRRWVLQNGPDRSASYFVMKPFKKGDAQSHLVTHRLSLATTFASEWMANAVKSEWCLGSDWQAREHEFSP